MVSGKRSSPTRSGGCRGLAVLGTYPSSVCYYYYVSASDELVPESRPRWPRRELHITWPRRRSLAPIVRAPDYCSVFIYTPSGGSITEEGGGANISTSHCRAVDTGRPIERRRDRGERTRDTLFSIFYTFSVFIRREVFFSLEFSSARNDWVF